MPPPDLISPPDIPGPLKTEPARLRPSNLKFDEKGNALHFDGNTIVSHIKDRTFFDQLQLLAEQLKLLYIPSLVLLPTSSFHITIFEGSLNKFRKAGFWPEDLKGLTIEECNEEFEARLKDVKLPLDPPVTMQISRIKPVPSEPVRAIGVRMKAATDAGDRRLRQARDLLSKVLGLRQANHEDYEFHISMGYIVKTLEAGQVEAIADCMNSWFGKYVNPPVALEDPEFCVFDNMLHFEPRMRLGTQVGLPS